MLRMKTTDPSTSSGQAHRRPTTAVSIVDRRWSVVDLCHRRELKLMGEHNIANVLAACAVSAAAGASIEAMRAVVTTFAGVAHRLQLVGEINGARYYDDSIATAPERLMAALRCFDQKVILLCGGRDKHLPWDDAVQLMLERCKHVICFGEMGPMVAGKLQVAVEKLQVSGDRLKEADVSCNLQLSTCDSMQSASAAARAAAGPGDVVLLSPGGTSYDAFKDFAERGVAFREWVQSAS
jgi:UDP-N-acetylmuramoylalanine--D-glutamate ligase